MGATEGEPAYLAPYIPRTPSAKVNDMLEQRCGRGFDQLFKALIAYYVCGIFTAIDTVYRKLYKDTTRHSQTYWSVACLGVVLTTILTIYLLFNVVYGFFFVIEYIFALVGYVIFTVFSFGFDVILKSFKISGIVVGIVTFALGVSGVAFFDKDGDKPKSS